MENGQEKDVILIRMVINMSGNLKMAFKKGKALLHGLMERFMKVIGYKINVKETDTINGVMAMNMKDSGKTILQTVKEY